MAEKTKTKTEKAISILVKYIEGGAKVSDALVATSLGILSGGMYPIAKITGSGKKPVTAKVGGKEHKSQTYTLLRDLGLYDEEKAKKNSNKRKENRSNRPFAMSKGGLTRMGHTDHRSKGLFKWVLVLAHVA